MNYTGNTNKMETECNAMELEPELGIVFGNDGYNSNKKKKKKHWKKNDI